VACIDGDAVAHQDWLQFLIQPFFESNQIVGTGGYVGFYKAFFANISSFFFFLGWSSILRPVKPFYFWWANFAVRRISYFQAGWFEPLLELYPRLWLSCPTEDLYLSLVLGKLWNIVYAKKCTCDMFFVRIFFFPRKKAWYFWWSEEVSKIL
jgi:hypothetical protein